MDKEGARRGRPALPPDEGKRFPLSIRTTKELKDQLEAASRASGRSLAQEVEYRLERSLAQEDALGGPRTAALLRALANLVTIEPGDKHWLDDYYAFGTITDRWRRLLEQQKPPLPDELRSKIDRIKNLAKKLKNDEVRPDQREILRGIISLSVGEEWPEADRTELENILAEHPSKED